MGLPGLRPGFFVVFLAVLRAAAAPRVAFLRVCDAAVVFLEERLFRIAFRAFVANEEATSPTIPATATSSPAFAVSTTASFAIEMMPSRSLSKVASTPTAHPAPNKYASDTPRNADRGFDCQLSFWPAPKSSPMPKEGTWVGCALRAVQNDPRCLPPARGSLETIFHRTAPQVDMSALESTGIPNPSLLNHIP